MKMDDLTQSDILNLPINKEICFSNHKNQFKEKIMKDQIKILTSFASFVRPFLEPGEEIWLGVKASSPMSFLEQLTTGWLIYYVKRCMLIFTNKRIFHFPARYNFTPKHSLSQIRYGDIEGFKLSAFLGRALKIEYKSGKEEKFYYIKSREFKKLKTLGPLFIKTQPSPAMERHFLCPRCTVSLLKSVFSCPNCRLEFKNMKEAIRLSILFPGGGYFYTEHPALGVMDAITEGFLLILLVSNIVVALRRMELWSSVLIVAIILSVEKLITIYHAKHYISEYIPTDKNFSIASSAVAPAPSSPYQQPEKQGKKKWLRAT